MFSVDKLGAKAPGHVLLSTIHTFEVPHEEQQQEKPVNY